MEFLEDVLKRYGITADYWPDEEPVRLTEGRVDKDALERSMLAGAEPGEIQEAGERVVQRVSADERLLLPLGMVLGDIRSERGQSRAALTAYEAVVLPEDDPKVLCELGYLLLQRCRVKHLPLSDKDYEGSIDFDGETVFVSPLLIHPGNEGPEFSDKGALLPLAIRAFGIAYVRCVERYFQEDPAACTWEKKWGELVALDSLRAAFIEEDNLDGLEATIAEYYGWREDYEEGTGAFIALARVIAKKRGATRTIEGEIEPDPEDLFYRFDLNFRDAQVYLRVRPKRPPTGEPDVMATLRLISWQLKELLEESRNKQRTEEQVDSLLERIAQKLESTPKYVMEASEELLARTYGDMWTQLPTEARRLLVQAHFLSSVLHTVVDVDWSPVVNQYARALETVLRTKLGRRLDQAFPQKHSWTGASIESFRTLFQSLEFARKKGVAGADRMRELGPVLHDVVKNYRNPAAHGAEPVSPVKASELRKMLVGTEQQRVGLLWTISSL